ncbi:hypothetical protein [Nocardioides jishulii]|uniref:Uncharacterized protein n=1 Tax=Nocardioides jishulii TaxID=2575440 RepID=A0A4U2YME5_9ACTN|nr:hypothetical protein [Nocardioides jishulii]QCX27600.1 hypothetical protein FCL41_08760 [Nocardioides jishulii]TKI62407.1 hypothetical protein FC770_08425 [Nocardioides jishulii]
MSKTLRIALTVLGAAGVAAAVAKRAGVLGGPTGPKSGVVVGLPLSCRLKGHTWRTPANNTQTPTRKTCQKCQTIDLPMP